MQKQSVYRMSGTWVGIDQSRVQIQPEVYYQQYEMKAVPALAAG